MRKTKPPTATSHCEAQIRARAPDSHRVCGNPNLDARKKLSQPPSTITYSGSTDYIRRLTTTSYEPVMCVLRPKMESENLLAAHTVHLAGEVVWRKND